MNFDLTIQEMFGKLSQFLDNIWTNGQISNNLRIAILSHIKGFVGLVLQNCLFLQRYFKVDPNHFNWVALLESNGYDWLFLIFVYNGFGKYLLALLA